MNIKSALLISALIGTTALAGCSNIPASTPCYVSVAECMKPGSASHGYLQMKVRQRELQFPSRSFRANGTTVIVSPGASGARVYD